MRIRSLTPFLAVMALACGGGADDQAATADTAQDYAAEATDGAADAAAAVAGVAEAWETHYNLGHGSMVADFHAPDGLFFSADGSMLTGRETIAAELTSEIEAGSPQISIETDETIVEGEWAVGRGTYDVTATPEGGEPMTNTGYWTALFHNVDGSWLIQGLATNVDSDQPVMPAAASEMPTADAALQIPPGLAELEEAYETHFNLGHAPMVADLYTEDAVAMVSGMPAAEGSAAIEQNLARRIEAGAGNIDLQPIGFQVLRDDLVGSVGTLEIAMGEETRTGFYSALYERGADGAWKIKWALSSLPPTDRM